MLEQRLHYRLATRCKALASHAVFTCAIVGATLLVGVNEALVANGRPYDGLGAVNQGLLALFMVEVAVKLVAEDRRPWRFFTKSAWNVFDFVVVALSLLDEVASGALGPIIVVRLLRLLRVVRLLHSSPGLRSVTHALCLAFAKVNSVLLMILVINYIFVAIGMLLFSRNDPHHFGSLSSAMMSVWTVEVRDDVSHKEWVA